MPMSPGQWDHLRSERVGGSSSGSRSQGGLPQGDVFLLSLKRVSPSPTTLSPIPDLAQTSERLPFSTGRENIKPFFIPSSTSSANIGNGIGGMPTAKSAPSIRAIPKAFA